MSSLKFAMWLLLGFCLPASVCAQEKPRLFEGVERAFREKEPRWKIERLDVKSEIDPLEQNIVLSAGGRQAALRIVVWKNVKDARDTFRAVLNTGDNTGRQRRQRLAGFGDEAYIRLNSGTSAWPTINFRKGGVNVTVFAPSTAIAKEFARHILGQINAAQY